MIVIDLPLPGNCRAPENAEDFGDDATVGLHVQRRVLARDLEYRAFHDFGLFLGWRWESFVVGILDPNYRIAGVERFATLDQLKSVWILD